MGKANYGGRENAILGESEPECLLGLYGLVSVSLLFQILTYKLNQHKSYKKYIGVLGFWGFGVLGLGFRV